MILLLVVLLLSGIGGVVIGEASTKTGSFAFALIVMAAWVAASVWVLLQIAPT